MRDKDHRREDTRDYGVSPRGVGGAKPAQLDANNTGELGTWLVSNSSERIQALLSPWELKVEIKFVCYCF